MLLADAGIGMSLVRTPASDREEWSTCFWLSVLFGGVLSFAVVGVAPLVAIVFAEDTLAPIVRALAAVVFFQSLFLIPRAAQQQIHQFSRIAGSEITAIAVGIVTAVAVALNGGGAWALVGQQLAFFTVRVALTCYWSPFRPILAFDVRRVREHLVFGRDMLTNNVIAFVTQSIDNLVVGKALGAIAVGMYSMAFQFARLPVMLITGPLQYVLYSWLVKSRDDLVLLRAAYLALTRMLAVAVFPAIGMVAAAHQPVFALLLSEKWMQSGHLFAMVAPACALQAVTAMGVTMRMILGRTDIVFRATVEFGLLRIGTLLVSVAYGVEWAALSYSAAVLLYTPRSLMLVLPIIGASFLDFLTAIAVPMTATLLSISLFVEVTESFNLAGWVRVVVAAMFAIVSILGSVYVQRSRLLAGLGLLQKALNGAKNESFVSSAES